MPIVTTFGKLLLEKQARDGRRIPMREISDRTGIALSTVNAWANNHTTRYDALVIEAFCNYFGCQPGDLIAKVDTPPGG